MVLKYLLLAAALALAPLAAHAQSTYRCVSKDGKKYYGSTIPQQGLGQPLEGLGPQGTVIRRIGPEGEEKARAAQEARPRKKHDKEPGPQEVRSGPKPPPKLGEDMRNSEVDLRAQEELLAVKKKEVEMINARYNEDKKRFIELTKRGK